MNHHNARRNALRRVVSSPDLSLASRQHSPSRSPLKRVLSTERVHQLVKRPRVFSASGACHSALPQVDVDMLDADRSNLRNTSRGRHIYRAPTAAQSYSPSPSPPAHIAAFMATRLAPTADSSSLASLSPLSDYPLDDVFDPENDLHVSSIALWTQDRVCAVVRDASAVLPVFPVEQQHSVCGVLSPIVPLLAQLSCPIVLAQIGLSIGPSADDISSLSSLVTVSSKQELQLSCSTSIFVGGALAATHSDSVSPSNNVSAHEYSVPIASSDFLTQLFIKREPIFSSNDYDLHMSDTNSPLDTTLFSTQTLDDTLVVLRFSTRDLHGHQKTTLVLACQFSFTPGLEGFVRLMRPILLPLTLLATPSEPPALLPSPTILSTPAFSPFPLGRDDMPVHGFEPLPKRAKRPNLTVAIPPLDRAQLLGAAASPVSAGLARGGLLLRLAPASPMPITPVEQVLHTPASPPPLPNHHSRASASVSRNAAAEGAAIRKCWVPTPTEANYPASMSLFYFDRAPTHLDANMDSPMLMPCTPGGLAGLPVTPTFLNLQLPPRIAAPLASPYEYECRRVAEF